jgi:nucleoside-diphosphate-sugar epimerase
MTAASSAPRAHVLIAGCGYVGQRLAQNLRDRYELTVLVRSADKAAALQRAGLRALTIDLDRVRAGDGIPERLDQEAIIYLAPPPATGESDLRLDRFLHLATVPPRTFLYMSTTGVYGHSGGALVDESTPVQPGTDRARRRISAEEMTRVWCTERRIRRVVLRVPGIYGPGRLPLDRLQRSEPVVRSEEAGISNRIHVDDLVAACATAIENKEARGVYNVTDGNSISATAFIDQVAKFAGLPLPPRVTMEEAQLTFSPERLSFVNESRRISNERMVKNLGVTPRYADIEAGIKASLAEEGTAL